MQWLRLVDSASQPRELRMKSRHFTWMTLESFPLPCCFDFLLGTLLLAIIMLSYSGPLEWFASCGLCGYNHESRLVPTLYHFHRTIAGGKQGHVQTLRRIQRSISGTLNPFFKVLILMQTGGLVERLYKGGPYAIRGGNWKRGMLDMTWVVCEPFLIYSQARAKAPLARETVGTLPIDDEGQIRSS